MADDTTTPSAPPPRQITITTPSRRAYSADPPTTTSLRRSLRTPGSNPRPPGLSASGRKNQNNNNNPPTATTPHGRAAIRALDSRRAAIFTPGRRRSLRDLQRETPRDLLRALSRNLAPKTEAVHTSSSPGGGGVAKSEGGDEQVGTGTFLGGDDWEEEGLLRVPRMSLPIDEDDDDEEGDWPRPHRSAGLEDENLTVQSVEFGRRDRAFSEQPRRRRSSMAGLRMSDVYGQLQLDEDGGGRDSVGFPPLHAIDEDAGGGMDVDDYTYERLEVEAMDARRETGRESDFGLVVAPPEGNDTTVIFQPEVADEEEEAPLELDDEPFGMEEEESHVHFADDVVGGQDEEEQEHDGGELDEEVEEEAAEFTMEVDSATAKNAAAAAKVRKKKAGVKVSRHGIQYPSLPPAVVKRLAQTFAKTSGVKGKISPDTLAAIMQASEWFFEQLGDDLQAYAKHAGRKTIDESDILQVMRRQRQINSSTTPFSLAQRYLPRELLQELRMPPPAPAKKSRAPRARANDDDEEVT
ncbi:hypothetical protein CONLIGDRAFT_298799 [Coniochaeta ligniaria NRRL 30616]|uniref:CENP-T/Histone H4 histone fold domain-containing protein n=1 Tax=Coniochaeta ligniaria NRRL 30616 TaxID=1408157 RepID=A0A1J7JCK1_9PEZI|nr:hypothetical protein CONLIGDRAFT_298799 [Coniochaeta ligniaria NRRL 30616]